uniref:Phosphatidylinositol-specific phospholipase C X domain-containing protein n=1 Tax=Lotharella globosa TaxID=91324 RepID=A0A7S3Z7B8_9EUKA
MKYRDNDVELQPSGFTVESAEYEITEFKVTNGQDPDNEIRAGRKYTLSDGKFRFRVGRKGSEDVANWFNERIGGQHSTFGHDAGKLNFAFIGTLTVTLAEDKGVRRQMFVFKDIAFAQGHTGTANNWWFGQKGAERGESNAILGVPDATESLTPATSIFKFRRGGNGVNRVDFSFEMVDDWMKVVPDTTVLHEMVLPGTHDAGMSKLSHCFGSFATSVIHNKFTKTQDDDVYNQLKLGSRYFDIRVDYDHDELFTYHRTGDIGCNGEKLTSVLNGAKAYLQSRPTETAIFKISQIRDNSADTKARIDTLLGHYDSILLKMPAPTNDNDLGNLPLGDVRGKLIIVQDYNEYLDDARGRFRYRTAGDDSNSGHYLRIYDRYSNKYSYDDMQSDQIEKWDSHAGKWQDEVQPYTFLLSWTLTPQFPALLTPGYPSIKEQAQDANEKLGGVLHDRIVGSTKPKPNIVYIDYIDGRTGYIITQYNF